MHQSLGMLVLGLVLIRLVLRALRPAPELVGLSPAMRRLARAGQAAAGPVPATLFLVIELPHVPDPDPALYAWLRPRHRVAAYALLALGAGHAALALKHHRDGVPVLARMIGRGFASGARPPSGP